MSENELNKCKDETPAITVTDILEQVKESICDACPLNRL